MHTHGQGLADGCDGEEQIYAKVLGVQRTADYSPPKYASTV